MSVMAGRASVFQGDAAVFDADVPAGMAFVGGCRRSLTRSRKVRFPQFTES